MTELVNRIRKSPALFFSRNQHIPELQIIRRQIRLVLTLKQRGVHDQVIELNQHGRLLVIGVLLLPRLHQIDTEPNEIKLLISQQFIDPNFSFKKNTGQALPRHLGH